jgi:DNA polymerase-1
MSGKKRLFLLDAYALIFRGYYAFIKNPRINSKGMNTSAIMGFMNSLLDVIKREKPDHLAVCFDKGGSQERTEMFTEYKANRDETPEAIVIAVPYIQKILEAMHIPVVVKAGFEADDIIGTLAKQAEKEDYQTFMVTPDKDFAQLVSENIFMYRPARMGNGIEVWGIPEVQAKFEVERPEQVIDYLGMMGDSVDNIPGLPGVGDKTAKKFIKQFGSMENLLENLDQVQGKLKEKIEANKDLGVLSKKLATIITDVPVQFNEKDYELSDPDMEVATAIFEELEFRRIQENFKKIFTLGETATPTAPATETLKTATASPAQFDLFNPAPGQGAVVNESSRNTQKSVNHQYQWVNSPAGRSLLLEKLLKQTSVCFDTETTGLNALQAELVGIAFSWEQHKGYYLAMPTNKEETQRIIDDFRPFFENPQIEKIGHNLKFDLKVLLKYKLKVVGPLFDTMIAHYLINPDMRHNMDVLAETYLNYSPQSIIELIGKKGKNQGNMRDVPLEQQTQYAVEDADITLQLKYHFVKELAEAQTTELFKTVELPLVEVLTDMEAEGINLNVDFLNDLSKTLTADIAALEKDIYTEVGETFNLASPKQLGVILFEKLKLVDKPKKTKTGQYSTAEDILSYLAKDHPIVAKILEWRSLQKLENTYVSALPNDLNPQTQRIHTVYNQAVAATGRLSSNNPNLQNIPIRTPRGQEVRKAFIPRDDQHILMAAVEFKFTGEIEEQDKNMTFLSNALLAALALIMLLLVFQFNSISKPIIILISIFLSFTGVFLGITLFQMPFVILMTMMGIISLSGIVVNNGVVLLDYTQLLIDRKKSLLDLPKEEMLPNNEAIEAIIEGGTARLRPVILTAITTILGLIPLSIGLNIDFFSLFSEWDPKVYLGGDNVIFWGPLAKTVIFGLAFATFLTLIIVPATFLISYQIKLKWRTLFKK